MSKQLVEITGFAELEAKIKRLGPDREKTNEMVKVLRKVAQPVVRAAKRNVPKNLRKHLVIAKRNREAISPELLAKSIGIIRVKSDDAYIAVGPRAKGNNKGFYGHWAEYGVNIYRKGFKRKHSASDKARSHNAGGVQRKLPGAYFMKKTAEQTGAGVSADAEKSVAAFIQKRINALSK